MRWAGALLLFACGSDPSGPVGAFTANFEKDSTVFTVSHPSGLNLRFHGFASRAARATYEMQFGSFLINEAVESDWRVATKIESSTTENEVKRIPLRDDQGVVGSLELQSKGDSLSIRFIAAEGNRARIQMDCDASGGFLGLGAHTHDVDHRGQVVPIWVSEQGIGKVDTNVPADVWFLVGTRHQSYLAVPTLLAPRGGASYGLHATTLYRSIWDLCATDSKVLGVEVWEGNVELLIAPGPTPLDVIRQQTEHTGRIVKLPDWGYGVWMDSVGGEAAVRAEVSALRDAQIPVSAVWTEDWRGAVRSGRDYVLEEDWRWDTALYPTLPDMIAAFSANGIKFQTYFNTFVAEDVDVWEEVIRDRHYVADRRGQPYTFLAPDFENSTLADLFLPEHRDFVKAELRRALDLGIAGWMADYAEWYPADPRTVTTSDGSDSEAAHHRYPVAWAEVNREVTLESGRDDLVIFHRSGYTGSQGLAQVIWAGDQRTSFDPDDGLPTVVPLVLGLSAVGFPVVTHDIGGYASATNPPTTKDLFFRWTSLGALSPIMRTHHGRSADLNWRWNRDAETTAHFRRWAELHTRLFPFFAGLGLEAAETGAPISRPLAFADPADERLHGVRDTFLLGDSILVAPVLTASTAVRSIVLPQGAWYPWQGGAPQSGDIEVPAPLTELPILVRAGALVPLLPQGVQSLNPAQGLRTLAEVRFEREAIWWLGGEARVRDPGGTWVAQSPRRPQTIVRADGATDFVASANSATFSVSGTRVVLIDDSGAEHLLTLEGFDSRYTFRIEARW